MQNYLAHSFNQARETLFLEFNRRETSKANLKSRFLELVHAETWWLGGPGRQFNPSPCSNIPPADYMVQPAWDGTCVRTRK